MEIRKKHNDQLTYKYSYINKATKEVVWEREPSRRCCFQNQDHYQGELGLDGTSKWRNVESVFIVNGMVDKADANFVGGLFFSKIGDMNIFIGPYPQTESDVSALHTAGITAVLNVQTDVDLKHRSVDW